jgi:hypothetical protein
MSVCARHYIDEGTFSAYKLIIPEKRHKRETQSLVTSCEGNL